MSGIPFFIVPILMLVFVIVFLLLIGRIVYKDAKLHNMQAGMWTVIVLLVPNMIGLIIYLVARSNQPKLYHCSNCNAQVKEDYNICPQCQEQFGEMCPVCKKGLEQNQRVCPYCGTEIAKHDTAITARKVLVKSNIGKKLVLVIGSYFLFAVVMIFMISYFTINHDITMDKISKNSWDSINATISIDNSNIEVIQHRFRSISGHEVKKLHVYADENPQIDISISLEGGEIELQIEDANENIVATKQYIGSIDEAGEAQKFEESIPLDLSENTTHYVKFIYRKAKNGTIRITG